MPCNCLGGVEYLYIWTLALPPSQKACGSGVLVFMTTTITWTTASGLTGHWKQHVTGGGSSMRTLGIALVITGACGTASRDPTRIQRPSQTATLSSPLLMSCFASSVVCAVRLIHTASSGACGAAHYTVGMLRKLLVK